MRRLGLALVVLWATSAAAEGLTVSVASSLRDAATAIVAAYREAHPSVTVDLNHGPSGFLARQIEDGAPVDVFLSAGWPEIDRLRGKDLTAGEPMVIARNGLVLVVPVASPWRGREPRALLEAAEVQRIASGDPALVPFGAYAKQALEASGLWERVRPKLVFATEVRQALTYADQGSVEAAIVYATDARVAKSAVLLGAVPGSERLKIESVAVRTKRSTADATSFFTFLGGATARGIFEANGFLPPS